MGSSLSPARCLALLILPSLPIVTQLWELLRGRPAVYNIKQPEDSFEFFPAHRRYFLTHQERVWPLAYHITYTTLYRQHLYGILLQQEASKGQNLL
jgi:hypothetical protein